jgi:hypothetical protein
MHIITEFEVLDKYRLKVTFEDGTNKTLDLESYLYGEVFEPLKDSEYFKKVFVDADLGTICWPNGADFCPDYLYSLQ